MRRRPPDDAALPRRTEGENAGPGGEPHTAPLEEALDLHAFHPRDVREVVTEYLWMASRAGLREVRIIHGKGRGVQRRIVEQLLAQRPEVESFRIATAERGHYGATLVRLRDAAPGDGTAPPA
ncbi:MAG: Smr/MutS family protein [Candidatus Eisenbacteria bacterium]|uniref:Smr/MutS family protein n=1 Tax=Eiseniibacteriota bacterium TaxID=2212470 RepID=A0A937X8P8_UNCEI|nr:Smr/MutS family protein [Candidatus Eisenbacteria bacterium]